MISDVFIKKVIKHSDKDGFFAEMVKFGEETFHKILQTSYSETKPGVIKAWHIHDYPESWCVVKGKAMIVLHDLRPDSPTYQKTQVIYAGEDDMKVIAIPGNVAHGYKNTGDQAMGIIYHSSEAYDPTAKAIREIPFDDKTINFDWKKL